MIADQKGLELLDVLTIISFAMQMGNYRELKSQASTDDIFAELQRQDNVFLAQILENQEKMLKNWTTCNILDCKNSLSRKNQA